MTVRAHNHTCTQVERRLTLAVPPDAGDAAVLDHQTLDGETLAHLGSRLRRRVHQQLVEHGAPRGVGERGLVGPGGARDRHAAEVEGIGVDAGTARGQQPVEQAPVLQRRHPGGMDEVGRDRVRGKRCLVDDEHPVALAGEQHRRRRAGAARARHDRVEFDIAHVEAGSYGRRARASSHGRAKCRRPATWSVRTTLRAGRGGRRMRWRLRVTRRRAWRRCSGCAAGPCGR